MQKICHFVDSRKFAAVAPDESLLSDNASESFKNTCLGPIGHSVSAPELEAAAVDQEAKYLGIQAIFWKGLHQYRGFTHDSDG